MVVAETEPPVVMLPGISSRSSLVHATKHRLNDDDLLVRLFRRSAASAADADNDDVVTGLVTVNGMSVSRRFAERCRPTELTKDDLVLVKMLKNEYSRVYSSVKSYSENKTRSFAITKRTARRSCSVDLVHCQHCFLRHMG